MRTEKSLKFFLSNTKKCFSQYCFSVIKKRTEGLGVLPTLKARSRSRQNVQQSTGTFQGQICPCKELLLQCVIKQRPQRSISFTQSLVVTTFLSS